MIAQTPPVAAMLRIAATPSPFGGGMRSALRAFIPIHLSNSKRNARFNARRGDAPS